MTASPRDPALELDAVRALFEAIDPAPSDLADKVIARVVFDQLDTDMALLELLERSTEAVGSRTAQVESLTLQFGAGELKILLRASPGEDGLRLDGWLSPARAMAIYLEGPETVASASSGLGRFTLDSLPHGRYRLRVEPLAGAEGTAFVTVAFDL